MNNSEKRVKTSKRNFVLALILLLLTNVVTSVTLVTMSRKTLRQQIELHMLDISNTAASLIDGDTIAEMTNADVGSPEYEASLS